MELRCDLPHADTESENIDSLPDESLLLINMTDPWYGDFLLYVQKQCFRPGLSRDEHCHIFHHVRHYLTLGDTLYHCGIDSILRQCLTHNEAKFTLNDYHSGACGGHHSGLATDHKILCAGYFGL